MWSYTIFSTRDGEPQLDVTPVSADWVSRLSGEGTGSFTLSLTDAPIPRDTLRALLLPTDRTIAVRWGSGVAYAGMIQRVEYDRESNTVTFSTVELRNIFRWRLTFGVASYTSGDLTVTNRSPAATVRAILLRAQDGGTTRWDLPLDLPADAAGSFSAEWLRSDLFTINDLLKQVEKDGNEFFLRPYIDSDGWLRWDTEVGAPISLGVTDIPVGAAGSPVRQLRVVEDGAEQVSGVFVAGNGFGNALLHSHRDLSGGGVDNFPIRDAYWQAKDVKNQSQLDRVAEARFDEFNPVLVQRSLSVDVADLGPLVVAPGRDLNLDFRGDLWVPDGVVGVHVVALRGSTGLTVGVETR